MSAASAPDAKSGAARKRKRISAAAAEAAASVAAVAARAARTTPAVRGRAMMPSAEAVFGSPDSQPALKKQRKKQSAASPKPDRSTLTCTVDGCSRGAKPFSNPSTLERHMLLHTDTFACPDCAHTSCTEADRISHWLVKHCRTGYAPYKCGLCPVYVCETQTKLWLHERTEHRVVREARSEPQNHALPKELVLKLAAMKSSTPKPPTDDVKRGAVSPAAAAAAAGGGGGGAIDLEGETEIDEPLSQVSLSSPPPAAAAATAAAGGRKKPAAAAAAATTKRRSSGRLSAAAASPAAAATSKSSVPLRARVGVPVDDENDPVARATRTAFAAAAGSSPLKASTRRPPPSPPLSTATAAASSSSSSSAAAAAASVPIPIAPSTPIASTSAAAAGAAGGAAASKPRTIVKPKRSLKPTAAAAAAPSGATGSSAASAAAAATRKRVSASSLTSPPPAVTSVSRASPASIAAGSDPDIASKLDLLITQHSFGHLSASEFAAAKRRLLGL